MEEDDVVAYVNGIEDVLAHAATQRTTLSNDVDHVERVVEALHDAQQKIEGGLTAAKSTLRDIRAVVQSMQHGIDGVDAGQNDLPLALENIAGHAEEVLRAEAIERIEAIRRLPEEFGERIDGLIEDGKEKVQAANDWLDERMEALVAASVTVREKAEALAELVGETKDELVEKTGEASAGVVKILEDFGALSGEKGDALIDVMADHLEQAISAKIEELTNGTLDEVKNFADNIDRFAGQITDKLSGITETIGKIEEITRPVQPVLEMAGSIA